MSPTPHDRERIGFMIRAERKSRSLSIEAAAKAGGIGHMTWRKIEQGGSVHDQSYYAIDRAFGWESGHTLATVNEEFAELTPAPGARDDPAPPATKTEKWAAADPGRGHGLPKKSHESAFDTVLQGIESLTLGELKTVSKIAEREIAVRNHYSDSASRVMKALQRYPFNYIRRYTAETSVDVSRRYSETLAQYMGAWEAVQNYAFMVRDLAENKPGNMPEIKRLHETLIEADISLMEVSNRLNEVEEEARANLGDDAPLAANETE